jgi:hypothetical protein
MAMRWQIKSTLLVAAMAPPVAGLIVQVLSYWPQWHRTTSEPNQVLSFVMTAVFLTIPVSYVYGFIPSAVAGLGYCGILTYVPLMRHRRWLRTIPAALTGGAVGALGLALSASAAYYAVLSAVVAGLLAIFIPRPEHDAF